MKRIPVMFDAAEQRRIEAVLGELPDYTDAQLSDASGKVSERGKAAALIHNNYLLAAILLELRQIGIGQEAATTEFRRLKIALLALGVTTDEFLHPSQRLAETGDTLETTGEVAQQPGAVGHGGNPHDE